MCRGHGLPRHIRSLASDTPWRHRRHVASARLPPILSSCAPRIARLLRDIASVFAERDRAAVRMTVRIVRSRAEQACERCEAKAR